MLFRFALCKYDVGLGMKTESYEAVPTCLLKRSECNLKDKKSERKWFYPFHIFTMVAYNYEDDALLFRMWIYSWTTKMKKL